MENEHTELLKARELLADLYEHAKEYHREYGSNGPDYCEYCCGEAIGWDKDHKEYNTHLYHKAGCLYVRLCNFLGESS